ncbi:MAG: hypothetical protein Tsb0019_02370 [Roseibium sp.]
MARFPYYGRNIAALGRLLAEARLDENLRARLLSDPKKELRRIGLPANVTELMDFKTVDDTRDKAVALPFKLNEKRLAGGDEDYLVSLASSFTRAN